MIVFQFVFKNKKARLKKLSISKIILFISISNFKIKTFNLLDYYTNIYFDKSLNGAP